MWAIGQLIVGALLVVIIVEPVIRRLQRERSEGDREQAVRQELLSRLQKMAGQLPGMVYQFRLRPDGTSHFPYSSEGIRQIYGVSPESVQDDAGGVFAVLHPDDTARVREAILLSAARLTHWRDEYRVCLPDGRERWVLGNAAPEREPDGGILWHGFITDVTERRNAMQAIADARTLLQSVLDAATEAAIIATDVTGRITVFNSGAERMLQYQSAEMVGRLNPLVDQQAESPAHERPYVRKDGTRLTVSRSVTAIRNADGGINGYLSVATDVTERLEARESLQAAKDTAERANRAKSEFLATMSHEIRTPMNGVLGFANLLKDTKLDAEQRDFVRTIESSGQILLAIINDILDFSKIEAGAMTLERIPFDLAPAVDEVAVMMQGKAEEKNLELVLSLAPNVPSRVVTDPGRLKQVLINLINNAIKFTSAGSVRVEVGVDDGERLQFSVQDTGIGIAPAAQAALFQKFSQADASTTRRYGGTGLGLAICRQLVELMGGRIGVESMPGCGSRFWFTIPLQLPGPTEHAAESRAAARSLAATVPAAGEPARVLIAEDNPVNQMVAMRLLKRLGCRVDVAHNGAEAVQMATRLPYSAIFMDCHMPEMDGFEAARAIRRRENALGLSSTAIIALTASVLQEDRERCLSAGMDDIIGKPVQIADLAKVLRRFVVVDIAQE
jgi:PAS domain S-box-containing protein